ncbi:MAG: MarR family transcriptional regulator [Actinomycetota bacterium]|nr:MAG: MarR family transcriptional regulator [Actinomycetota bacterium]
MHQPTIPAAATLDAAGPTDVTEAAAYDVALALFQVTRAARRVAGPASLDLGTLSLLMTLQERGSCRAADVADVIGLDSSTVSRHLARMEQAGLIVRSHDPVDRRAHAVSLTERGHAALTEVCAGGLRSIAPAVEQWTPADRTTLYRLLVRLAGDLGKCSRPGRTPAPQLSGAASGGASRRAGDDQ